MKKIILAAMVLAASSVQALTPKPAPSQAGPIAISALYSASDSTGTVSPVSSVPAPLSNVSNLSATLTLSNGNQDAQLVGLLMATVDGSLFGESEDLTVNMNIAWSGSVSAAGPAPAPVPSLGLLGIVALVTAVASFGAIGVGRRKRE